jgi:hypothetical protein
MAKRPVMPPKALLREYYIYDPGTRDTIGGFRVINNKQGDRVVLMTDLQAGYWVSAGVIGRIKLSDVSNTVRNNLHQMSGGRIPLQEGDKVKLHMGKRTRTPVARTAKQNPNTMADKLTEGYHPVLGTTQTNEDERRRSPQQARHLSEGGTGGLKRGE